MTPAEFIETNGLSMKACAVPANPNVTDKSWKADHWYLTLEKRRKNYHGPADESFELFYSCGIGHRDKHGIPRAPKIEAVLECLALDSSAIDTPFEEWADEFGYSRDSRNACATWETCVKQARELRDMLGVPTFNQLREIVW